MARGCRHAGRLAGMLARYRGAGLRERYVHVEHAAKLRRVCNFSRRGTQLLLLSAAQMAGCTWRRLWTPCSCFCPCWMPPLQRCALVLAACGEALLVGHTWRRPRCSLPAACRACMSSHSPWHLDCDAVAKARRWAGTTLHALTAAGSARCPEEAGRPLDLACRQGFGLVATAPSQAFSCRSPGH